ncbi:peptide ABC transporter substrate-binding protein [Lentilactobacillus sp. Marseille-Q4993]|uniref:peptide ABC transporter substrate-binding protein n=1 Tax=Lentilactobacillus sp. Marseille-Q4993 TaxID=3039492 RepID=UPI0024BD51A3|nr:peptide ABC transporter substrate-binding protein [Lentilactobacillus sp. Marseille-Q4993]
MRKKILTIMFICIMGITTAACGNKKAASFKNKPLAVTLADEPLTVDPNKSTDTNSASLISQIMEGLYKYDKNGNIVPGVAKSMAKVTNDGKTYTFDLRKDAKWSNGQPVTSKDFVASFTRMVDPKTKAQYASLFDAFKNFEAIQKGKMSADKLGVKALGDYKLQIQLTKRVPYINDLLADKYMPLNRDALKKFGPKYGTSAKEAVYNGPYKLEGWTGSNSKWSYVKNPYYWNRHNVKINKVNVTVTKEQNTAINLFNSGKIQETTVSGQYVKANKNNPELKTHLTGRLNYLDFSSKISKTNSENLRKAISYVLDRKQITDRILQDGSAPSKNMVIEGDQKNPSNGKDMANETGDLLKQNIAESKKYWNKYLQEIGKKHVTINLLTDNLDDDMHVGQYIQSVAEKNLKGLNITITSLPHAQHVQRDFDGKFEMNLTGWSTDWLDASDFISLGSVKNSVNFTHWKDNKFEKILTDANSKTGQARYDGLIKANKYLMSVQGKVPLYQPAEPKLVSKEVGGLTYSLLNDAQYQYAYWKK